MCVDGARTQAERFGNLSVGQAGGDQLQDMDLPGGQVIRIRLAQTRARDRYCIVLYGAKHSNQSRTGQVRIRVEGDGWLAQTVLDREAGRGAPVGNAQLAKNLAEVRVHGSTAEKKLVGDLGIGPSACQ